MDSDVINRKLESLRRCMARISSKMPATPDVLQVDYDLQDIIALNLERAVQLCVDLAAHVISHAETSPPNTMAESFDRLAELHMIPPQLATRLRKAVAFRNILVHNYTDINWRIVFNLITHNLSDFKQFARAIDRISSQD